MKRILFSLLLIVALSACGSSTAQPSEPVSSSPGAPVNPPTQPGNPYAPQAGDASLVRGEVYLDSAELLAVEINPPQYHLVLTGNLPDPCHQLRVQAAAPDASNRILVDIYAVADPNKMCAQMLQPFNASVPLSVSGLAAGHYTVWVNGNQVGEFDK
jgi:hypothetical protein